VIIIISVRNNLENPQREDHREKIIIKK
jgi:hypothetical protein